MFMYADDTTLLVPQYSDVEFIEEFLTISKPGLLRITFY